MPKTTRVSADSPSEKRSTRASMPTFSTLGRSPGLSASSASTPHCATSSPTAPPASASSIVSVRNCLSSRRRDAPRAAREQQVGDVGARDGEDESDRAEQDEERRPHVLDRLLVQPDHLDAAPAVLFRVRLFETPRDGP